MRRYGRLLECCVFIREDGVESRICYCTFADVKTVRMNSGK